MFGSKYRKYQFLSCIFVFFTTNPTFSFANDQSVLVDPVVLTVPHQSDGIEVILSTRDPIQPIPAKPCYQPEMFDYISRMRVQCKTLKVLSVLIVPRSEMFPIGLGLALIVASSVAKLEPNNRQEN